MHVLAGEVVSEHGHVHGNAEVPGGNDQRIKLRRFSDFQFDFPSRGLALFRIEQGLDIGNLRMESNAPFQIKVPCIFGQIGVHVIVVGKRLDVGVKIEIVKTGNPARGVDVQRPVGGGSPVVVHETPEPSDLGADLKNRNVKPRLC